VVIRVLKHVLLIVKCEISPKKSGRTSDSEPTGKGIMKKQIIVCIALITMVFMNFGFATEADAAAVCTETIRGIGSTAGAKLYYPCTISGQIPASTMSSGWTAGLSAIQWLSRPMASEGTVVLAFTPANRYGMVTTWKRAHTNCFNRLKQIASSHRKLAGKIDTSKMQIAGYSKGGGGSLAAAAALGSQVASVVGMAPYSGGEISTSAFRKMNAATFIQCGGIADSLARPTMTKMEFNALPSGISKLYRRHSAWSHLEWAFGINQGTIKREIFAWMDYYLRDKKTAANESILSSRVGLSGYQWKK